MALFKSVRHPVDSDGSLLPHVFGKPESLTAKQTQVDVTGDTLWLERGENCPFNESPQDNEPDCPLWSENCQGMKRPETRKQFLIAVCSSQNVLCNKRPDSCMHRRHGTYLKMSSTNFYLHAGKCVGDTIPQHDTDSQKNGWHNRMLPTCWADIHDMSVTD